MADVVFYQKQEFFNSNPMCRWARLIIREDDYSESAEDDEHITFDFEDEQCIGTKKIPVGITCEYYMEIKLEYENHRKKIINLLEDEALNPQVILYTTADIFKEAFYCDYTKTMKLNSKANSDRELIYWGFCGSNDCALLIAFEDLSIYKESD